MHNIDKPKLNKQAVNSGLNKSNFKDHLVHEAALSCNNIRDKNFDYSKATQLSCEAMNELNVSNGLETMLAAQMLSIHQLQQKTMAYAQCAGHIKIEKFYINSSIKLANCFVNQANLLAKLQGVAGQKIIMERVDVHQGGQAIVGNIHRGLGDKEN